MFRPIRAPSEAPTQMEAHALVVEKEFGAAREKFDALAVRLGSAETMSMTHSEVESLVESDGREVLRLLVQDHLDLRADADAKASARVPAIAGADAIIRTHRREQERPLLTLFGEVTVTRIGYGAPGTDSLRPLDAQLNLPEDKYSHGIRKRLSIEVARGAYDEAVAALSRSNGVMVPKRQVEQLATRAAADFEAFYDARHAASAAEEAKSGELVVLTSDGKGVPMLKRYLREETRKAAEAENHRLTKRLSKGEKPNRKRMATVASVYTLAPWLRSPEDILAELSPVEDAAKKLKRPVPEKKRVWACLEKDVEPVLRDVFAEAIRRDPRRQKRWVALVDGNATQLRLLRKLAKEFGVELTIVLDVIHVLEYLWKAAWAFHPEGDKAAEGWVNERFLEVLRGRASEVAGGIRRSATLRGLRGKNRKAADKSADYLLKYRRYLNYDEYLADGLPIATGVVEGACRYLVKDRCEVTGAHWSVLGAEAVLRLRSLRASGDFEAYWRFHLKQERARNYVAHYAGPIPIAASIPNSPSRSHLRVVK